MPQIDPVILQLRADVDQYRREVRSALGSAETQIERQQRSYQRLEAQAERSGRQIGQSLRRMAGVIAASFSVREIIRMSDSFTEFQNRLRVAGLEGERFNSVQEQLFQQAQRYGVELETLGTLYGRLALAQNALGASDEQILQFTEAVSAALRAQGGSAASAQGALLQLSQAIGGSIVRAEEFNSLLEGALPLVQAAANNIDGMGGSVARLREAVAEGEISSRQFFEAILRGADDLEAQANNSVLTISQSFTILTNALTRYIGEAGQTSGAAQAMAIAIRALAENVEYVVPAVAALAGVLGIRLVASLVAATAAMGPIALAITAITIALGGMAASSALAEARLGALRTEADAAENSLRETALRAQEAGVDISFLADQGEEGAGVLRDLKSSAEGAADGTKTLDTATSIAIGNLGLAEGAARDLANAYKEIGDQARFAAYMQARIQQIQAQSAARQAQERIDRRQAQYDSNLNYIPAVGLARRIQRGLQADDQRADREEIELQNSIAEARGTEAQLYLEGAPPPPTSGGGSAPSSSSSTPSRRTGSSRSGRSNDDTLRNIQAWQRQIEGLEGELLSARQRNVEAANEAANLETERVQRRYDAMDREIKSMEGINEAQRKELQRLNGLIFDQEQAAVLRDREIALAEEVYQIRSAERDGEVEALRIRSSMAETASERRSIELRLLDLQEEEERAQLEILRHSQDIATRRAAEARIANLDANRGLREAEINYRNRSPLQRYFDDFALSAEEATEAMEEARVRGFQNLEQAALDMIPSFDLIGGKFGKFIDAMIRDILLLEARRFAGSESGGGILSAIGGFLGLAGGGSGGGGSFSGFTNSSLINSIKLPGKASGGPVSAGQSYIVGENGREVLTMGQSGFITPNHALGGQGGSGSLVIRLGAGLEAEWLEKSAGQSVQIVREAAPQIADAGANLAISRSSRPTL